MDQGNSIANAIVIESNDYILGVLEEHNFIDKIWNEYDIEIQSIEQNFIIENGGKYDVFTLEMDNGSKKKVCFDMTSFFIIWST